MICRDRWIHVNILVLAGEVQAAMSDMSRRAVIAWLIGNDIACDGDGMRRQWRKDHGYSRKCSNRGRSTPTACATDNANTRRRHANVLNTTPTDCQGLLGTCQGTWHLQYRHRWTVQTRASYLANPQSCRSPSNRWPAQCTCVRRRGPRLVLFSCIKQSSTTIGLLGHVH